MNKIPKEKSPTATYTQETKKDRSRFRNPPRPISMMIQPATSATRRFDPGAPTLLTQRQRGGTDGHHHDAAAEETARMTPRRGALVRNGRGDWSAGAGRGAGAHGRGGACSHRRWEWGGFAGVEEGGAGGGGGAAGGEGHEDGGGGGGDGGFDDGDGRGEDLGARGGDVGDCGGGGGGAGRGYVDGGGVGGGCGEDEEGEEGWLTHCDGKECVRAKALVVRSGCGGWRVVFVARTLIG